MRRRTRLRVLHAAPYLWSGAGNVITRLIEAQAPDHAVALATSPRSGELRNWPLYDRQLAGLGIVRARIDLFHREPGTFWTAVNEMAALFGAFRPDVCHTHAGVPTAVAALARSVSSRRVALVSHFYSWGVGRPPWMNEMDIWAFRQADMVFCSARAYHEMLLAGGVAARRLRLLRWGLPVTAPAAAPRPLHGPPITGTLGRIERRKGQLDIVKAFAAARRRRPDAQLEIIGPIAERAYHAEVRNAVRELGLGRAVRLRGQVDDPRSHLSRLSSYVSLSSDEGQGLAILEAMAAGVPVVALGVAGVEDYLRDGVTGLAATSKSPRHVADLIDRTISDTALRSRLIVNGAALVRQRFSWSRTVAEIERSYRGLVDRADRRA